MATLGPAALAREQCRISGVKLLAGFTAGLPLLNILRDELQATADAGSAKPKPPRPGCPAPALPGRARIWDAALHNYPAQPMRGHGTSPEPGESVALTRSCRRRICWIWTTIRWTSCSSGTSRPLAERQATHPCRHVRMLSLPVAACVLLQCRCTLVCVSNGRRVVQAFDVARRVDIQHAQLGYRCGHRCTSRRYVQNGLDAWSRANPVHRGIRKHLPRRTLSSVRVGAGCDRLELLVAG